MLLTAQLDEMTTTAAELLRKAEPVNGSTEFLEERTPPRSKKIPAARRKPEKSRIVRVWQNEEGNNMTCPNCFTEFLSEDNLGSHLNTCRRKSLSPNHSTDTDHFSKYRIESSPEHLSNESNLTMAEESQAEESAGSYSHILKMLRQAVPQMSSSQQVALEFLLNAQMNLSKMVSSCNGRMETGESDGLEGRPSSLISIQQQQLLQLQLIQLLQAQLTVNGEQTPAPDADQLLVENRSRRIPETASFVSSSTERASPRINELIGDIPADERIANSPSPRITHSPHDKLKNISSLVLQHPDSPPPGVGGGLNTLEMLQKTADDVLNNASKGLLASRLIDSCREDESCDPNRRHRCRYCGKVFSSDSGLQIHIRSHTGERPFKCNICGNRFTTKGNLKVHFQRHQDQFPNIKMNPHPVPEHLDKFYPPLLPPNSENMGDSPSLPPAAPSIPVTPIAPTSPPFRPIGLRPPPPLNLNFKRLGETFSRPTPSEGLVRELPSNFIDFRLFRPFLVPTQQGSKNEEAKLSLNKEMSDNSVLRRSSNSSPMDKEDKLTQENIKKEDKDRNSPIHEDNLINDTYQENFKNVHKFLTANHFQNPDMDSLNIIKRHLVGSPRIAERNSSAFVNEGQFHDSLEFADEDEGNGQQPLNLKGKWEWEKGNGQQPLNLKAKEADTSGEGDEEEEERKNIRDDRDAYSSDSSIGPMEKIDKQDSIDSPMEFSHMPFLGIPVPPNLSLLQSFQMPFPGPLPPSHAFRRAMGLDPSKVPHIYTNLLPRPGSTDNSWEALIEVSKSDENKKIEELMDKTKERKTEPNQCGICQRVLSCKSALQMHYRIHTGERPFKCKICSRSFTTKGNLKTHMSVHRAKPPIRMLQQCPICHKKFSNALILQQHIKLHTGEPTDLSPEQIYAAEVRDFPLDLPLHIRFPPPGGLPSHLHPRIPFPPQHLPIPFYGLPKFPRKEDSDGKYGSPFSVSPRSSSTSSAEQLSAEDLSLRMRDEHTSESRELAVSPTLSDYSDIEEKSQELSKDELRNPVKDHQPIPVTSESSLYCNTLENSSHPLGFSLPPAGGGGFSSTPKDHSGKPPLFPFFPPLGLFNPLNPNGTPLHGLSVAGISPLPEGNTTCKICFKIFACQSALEIHLRSHTKERPFKCNYCDRGFSTKWGKCNSYYFMKGNLKQHVATHKQKASCSGAEGERNSAKRNATSPSASAEENSMSGDDQCGTASYPSSDPPTASSNDGTDPRDDDKNDSGTKRVREGELSLPDPKRSIALPDGGSEGTTTQVDCEEKKASPSLTPEASGAIPSTYPPISIPFPISMGISPQSLPFGSHLPLSLPTLSLTSPLSTSKGDAFNG